MKQTFDTEDLSGVMKAGDELFLSEESANQIAAFEVLYKQMTDFRKLLLEKIEQVAVSLDPNFKSIDSDKVRIMYSAHGTKYTIDQSKLSLLASDFYSTEVKVKPNTEAIDSYAKEHKGLPEGVIEPDRKKSVSIRLSKDNG